MRFNIFVVIVTYGNRFNLLKQVIDAVLDEHVNRIIVVDNNSQTESRNNLKKYQEKYSNILKVFYQYKNTGSAAGFKFGIKEAYNSKECDFILLLDDDNVVMKNCITNFINLYDIYSKIFNNKIALMMYRKYSYFDDYLCCSSKILKNNYYRGFNIINTFKKRIKNSIKNKKISVCITEVNVGPYGGLFFKKDLVTEIGYPDEKFFLYADDFEYTYRISSKYKILLIRDIYILDIDRSFNINKRGILNNAFIKSSDNDKLYYIFRNSHYFELKVIKKRGFKFTLNMIIYIIILSILAVINFKFRKIKIIIKAIFDSRKIK